MSELTAASLFAGIEGIGLALHRAGIRTTAAVEIDPAARGVIADQFPDTTLLPDVTKVTADDLRATGFGPRTGIVTAGFPCQDLSVAGRRKGMGEGTRSGLWWHVVRLLAELRPTWFLGENVPGLLSATCPCPGDGTCGTDCPLGREPHGVTGGICEGGCIPTHGGAMGAVLGSLAELGYGFAYRVLDAQHFGVPQRRRRVFIVGHLGGRAAPVQVLLEPEGRGRDSAAGRTAGTRVAATLTAGSHGVGSNAPGQRSEDDDNIVVSTLQGGGKRGHRVDAESAAGGLLVPFALHENQRGEITTPDTVGALNTGGGKPGQGYPAVAYAVTSKWAKGTGGPAGDEAQNLITHALTAEGADASEDGTGRGTPLVPIDLRNATRGTEAGDTAGMGVGGDGDPSFTLSAAARALPGIATATAVRRLTPLECERLQGFPDGWTLTSNGKPQSDSARYRQLGNAVAVPVCEWIARRIAATDRQAVAS